jgi:predicted ATPase/class 3 adenylate cyclase
MPSGTVTFLFTDIEGSTRLWKSHPDEMRRALARHDELVRAAIEANGGHVVKTTGDGFHAAFSDPGAAVGAAIDAQRSLVDEVWALPEPVQVRMGLHSGAVELRDGDYYGTAVNKAARLMSAAHGGQIVVSLVTEELVRDALPDGAALVELGEHQLRDVGREMVFQVHGDGLRQLFPPLQSLDRGVRDLPTALTSFVGRERDLATLLEALTGSRIVTLIGVGGVGKTRLALELAEQGDDRYGDGVWFCELGSVSDRGAVPEAVAACLGVRQLPGQSLVASLVAFLRRKHALLVLDNCEHLIEATGTLAEAISRGCPDVKILATSREALAIDGESLRPVGSLAVPDEDAAPDQLAHAPAAQLFADRARAVRPDFVLDDTTAPIVAEICRRLDGVPLAIELAAARVGSLSVNEIAQRLDHRFRLLTGGRRTAMERHQTLRGTVDWSYELLTPQQARMFNRLAVFAGGFTLDAAEAVAADDPVESLEVLDVLSGLLSRSMIGVTEANGTTRYHLLETMRQYARERLDEAGESAGVHERHAHHFLGLAEDVAIGVTGADEPRWVRIVDAELANLRAALDWYVATGNAEQALRLVLFLGRFGFERASYNVWRWIEHATNLPEARHHPLRPPAMALAAVPQLILTGNIAISERRLEEVDAAFAEAGMEPTSVARFAHAGLASVRGHSDEVKVHGAAAIELSWAAGDAHLAGLQSCMLSLLLATHGDIDAAVARAQDGSTLGRELANPSLSALAECALGYALSAVDPEVAVVHLERAITMSELVANEMARDVSSRALARAKASLGDLGGALEAYAASLEYSMDVGASMAVHLACESLAVTLTRVGHHDVAATIFGALEAPDGDYQGNPFVGGDLAMAQLRAAMPDRDYEQTVARGREMDLDALCAFACSAIERVLSELRDEPT